MLFMKKYKRSKSFIEIKLDEKDNDICLLELKRKVGSPKHISFRKS